MEGCKTADFVPIKPPGFFRDVARWVTGTLGGRDLQRAKLSVLQRLERRFWTKKPLLLFGSLQSRGCWLDRAAGLSILARPAPLNPRLTLALLSACRTPRSPRPRALCASLAPPAAARSTAGPGRAERAPPPASSAALLPLSEHSMSERSEDDVGAFSNPVSLGCCCRRNREKATRRNSNGDTAPQSAQSGGVSGQTLVLLDRRRQITLLRQ